ncbi:MAG: hypothetical protein ACN4GG_08765 [Akkermansiaceae bacterium]
MSEEPEEEVQSGRLRAEDRRGRVYQHFQGDDFSTEEEVPPADPEEEWDGEQKESKNPWAMRVLAMIIITVIIGVISYSMTETQEYPSVVSTVVESPAVKFHETASPEEINKEAERVISGFMNAKTHRERSAFILRGEDRISQLEEFYARERVDPPMAYGGKVKVEPYSLEGEALYVGIATSPVLGEYWPFHLRSNEAGFLIDWEASVGYGEILWDDFIKEKSVRPVQMRVYLTGILAPLELSIADEEFRTFEISYRGKDSKIITSVKRGSEIEQALAKMVPRSASHPINLFLKWQLDDDGVAKVEISHILHNYWVAPRP